MGVSHSGKSRNPLLYLPDARLPRERQSLLLRILHNLRRHVAVEILPLSATEESTLALVAQVQPCALLLPWYHARDWRKLDASLGVARSSGPAVIGYSGELTTQKDFGLTSLDRVRHISMDLHGLSFAEALLVLKALLNEQTRAGIRAFLRPDTLIHCETWTGSHGKLGERIDAVASLPEIKDTEWSRRVPSLRLCLSSLWSMVFELGPLKGQLVRALTAKTPKAYFQIAADSGVLAMRLCYTMTKWSPVDVLSAFWPSVTHPSSAPQLLNRFGDLIRVHPIADTSDLEIVVLLLPSAPSEKLNHAFRSLWIEPLSPHLVHEPIYEAPSASAPWLRELTLQPSALLAGGGPHAKLQLQLLQELRKERDHSKALETRIDELRSGGLQDGELPIHDLPALAEIFLSRCSLLEAEIQQARQRLLEGQNKGIPAAGIEILRAKLRKLELAHAEAMELMERSFGTPEGKTRKAA